MFKVDTESRTKEACIVDGSGRQVALINNHETAAKIVDRLNKKIQTETEQNKNLLDYLEKQLKENPKLKDTLGPAIKRVKSLLVINIDDK